MKEQLAESVESAQTVGDGCVEFLTDQGIGINLVEVDDSLCIPRAGEIVHLPGADGKGRGRYHVDRVEHHYQTTESGPAYLGYAKQVKVTVFVSLIR